MNEANSDRNPGSYGINEKILFKLMVTEDRGKSARKLTSVLRGRSSEDLRSFVVNKLSSLYDIFTDQDKKQVLTDTFTHVIVTSSSSDTRCTRWLRSVLPPRVRLTNHVTPRGVSNVLKHLIGSFYNSAYEGDEWTEELYAKQTVQISNSGLIDRVVRWLNRARNGYIEVLCTCERDYAGELFLWAILLARDDLHLALNFWSMTKEPLTAALVAHLLLKQIIDKCEMTSLKQAYLMEQVQYFEDLAVHLLTHYRYHNIVILPKTRELLTHQQQKKLIQESLITVSDTWGRVSPIRLAFEAKCIAVTSSDVCWRVVRKTWWNISLTKRNTITESLFDVVKQRPWMWLYVPCVSCLLNTVVHVVFLVYYGLILLTDFRVKPLTTNLSSIEVFLLLYVIGLNLEEIIQIFLIANDGRLSYWRSRWHYIDMLATLVYYAGLIAQHFQSVNAFETARSLRAISFLLFSYRLFRYMASVKYWGVQQRVFSHLLSPFLWFVAVLVLLIGSVSVALHSLLCVGDDSVNASIFAKPWFMLYGEISHTDLTGTCNAPTNSTAWTNVSFPLAVTSWLTAPAVAAFHLLTVNLFLLSGLVAIFVDVCAEVRPMVESEWKHAFIYWTVECYQRSFAPPPFSIAFQIFKILKKGFPKNPFEIRGNCKNKINMSRARIVTFPQDFLDRLSDISNHFAELNMFRPPMTARFANGSAEVSPCISSLNVSHHGLLENGLLGSDSSRRSSHTRAERSKMERHFTHGELYPSTYRKYSEDLHEWTKVHATQTEVSIIPDDDNYAVYEGEL